MYRFATVHLISLTNEKLYVYRLPGRLGEYCLKNLNHCAVQMNVECVTLPIPVYLSYRHNIVLS